MISIEPVYVTWNPKHDISWLPLVFKAKVFEIRSALVIPTTGILFGIFFIEKHFKLCVLIAFDKGPVINLIYKAMNLPFYTVNWLICMNHQLLKSSQFVCHTSSQSSKWIERHFIWYCNNNEEHLFSWIYTSILTITDYLDWRVRKVNGALKETWECLVRFMVELIYEYTYRILYTTLNFFRWFQRWSARLARSSRSSWWVSI